MRKTSVFLIALACLLAMPAAAGASVTLGPANPNPDPENAQGLSDFSEIVRFTTLAPSGVELTAPHDGVITSWQVFTSRSKGEATVRLRIVKPEGGGKYALVGAGPVNPIPEKTTVSPSELRNVQHVFATRVPIAAGQMVGVAFAHEPGGYIEWVRPVAAGFADGCFGTACLNSIPADGTAAEPLVMAGQYLAMNATLEPDADRDGFGDETQDPCVGVCAPVVPISTVLPPAKKKCKKGKKLKRGKCVKKHKKRHKKPKK